MFADYIFWISHRYITFAFKNCQECIEEIENWMDKWKLKINPYKNQLHPLLPFPSRCFEFQPPPNIGINNQLIKLTKTASYLGIQLDFNSGHKTEIAKITTSTNFRVKFLELSEQTSSAASPTPYYAHTRPSSNYRAVLLSTATNGEIKKLNTTEYCAESLGSIFVILRKKSTPSVILSKFLKGSTNSKPSSYNVPSALTIITPSSLVTYLGQEEKLPHAYPISYYGLQLNNYWTIQIATLGLTEKFQNLPPDLKVRLRAITTTFSLLASEYPGENTLLFWAL